MRESLSPRLIGPHSNTSKKAPKQINKRNTVNQTMHLHHWQAFHTLPFFPHFPCSHPKLYRFSLTQFQPRKIITFKYCMQSGPWLDKAGDVGRLIGIPVNTGFSKPVIRFAENGKCD